MLQFDATFIFVLISFVLFIFLMDLICYKPILNIIAKRREFYEKNKQTVKRANSKRDEAANNLKKQIQNAKFESSKMLNEQVEKNKAEKQEFINEKKLQITTKMNQFEQKLNESSACAKNQLKSEIEFYVKNTVAKLLDVDPETVYPDTSKINEIIK